MRRKRQTREKSIFFVRNFIIKIKKKENASNVDKRKNQTNEN